MNLQVRPASHNLLGRVSGSGQRGSKSTTGHWLQCCTKTLSQLPFLQVYRSYYDNPSGTPYAVGAAGSPDYVQEYIVEKFEADCNQVGISEIFQPFL